MHTRATRICLVALFASTVACGDDGSDGDPGEVETFSVQGTVVDFQTGEALSGSSTVSTSGLEPPPTVSVTGAEFTLVGVPPASVFHILAGNPPNYRSTYNVATVVDDADVDGVEAMVLSEAFLTELSTTFGVTPAGGTSVLVARAQDENGEPVAGIPAAAFQIDNAAPVSGPFFLDADLAPDPAANETSDSGWVVFFAIQPGLVTVNAAPGAGYTLVMSASPSAATAATVAEIEVTLGDAIELPMNVSLSQDVMPLFERRGCTACHSGGGIGKDLGNLTLDGSANLVYRELTEEISPNHQVTRVNLEDPEASLLLTLPSPESPPDPHPNVTFASPLDPDYLILQVWIEEGALKN